MHAIEFGHSFKTLWITYIYIHLLILDLFIHKYVSSISWSVSMYWSPCPCWWCITLNFCVVFCGFSLFFFFIFLPWFWLFLPHFSFSSPRFPSLNKVNLFCLFVMHECLSFDIVVAVLMWSWWEIWLPHFAPSSPDMSVVNTYCVPWIHSVL